MKRATKKQIDDAIDKVFQERNYIKTLKQVHEYVNEKIKPVRISLPRLKKILLKRKDIVVKVKKRELKNKKIENCPVCGCEFEKIFGLDAFGQKRHIGYKCKCCNFKIGLFYSVPYEYLFKRKE
ncbi:MAG: hypothetical protein QXZ43_03920 [Candidatus Aenigmatarchaeota archaeon]